jgi:hypothetical protein
MFIRFRKRARRLNVIIVEARRLNGAVRQTHVASLGSVTAEQPSVRERGATWKTLHEVIARKGFAADIAVNLMTALQARVPLPTMEEAGAAELAAAEHDSAFWRKMHGHTTKLIESHKNLIATAELQIEELRKDAEREAEKAEVAKAKATRLANYKGA